MAKIVISENVTLDGVIQDPAGDEGSRHGGWVGLIKDRPQLNKLALDEALGTEALLLGRRSYEWFAARDKDILGSTWLIAWLVAGPGSGFSEEPLTAVRSVTLECRVVPGQPSRACYVHVRFLCGAARILRTCRCAYRAVLRLPTPIPSSGRQKQTSPGSHATWDSRLRRQVPLPLGSVVSPGCCVRCRCKTGLARIFEVDLGVVATVQL
jgi:hypothetical protein